MNRNKYCITIYKKAIGYLMLIYLSIGLVFGSGQMENPEKSTEFDIAVSMAEGIKDKNVNIVVAEIPAKQDVGHIFKGMSEKELMNALSLFSNYSLYQLKIVEKIRGEVAKDIFVTPILDTANMTYSPFNIEPNSTWILFLVSPLNPKSKNYNATVSAFGDIEYNKILSKTNYFKVFNKGYSAYCLSCIERALKEGVQEITTNQFISDIRKIVRYSNIIESGRSSEEKSADMLNKLGTEIGKKILVKISQK